MKFDVNEFGVLLPCINAKGDLVVPEGVKELSRACFQGSKITSISLPKSLEIIQGVAFRGCRELKKIVINGNLSRIGGQAFIDCSKLENVIFKGSVNTIESEAFKYCSSLKELILPDGIKSIGIGAFKYCASLINIVLPDSLEEIKYNAFEGCTNLPAITFPPSLKSFEKGLLFSCNSLKNITIAKNPKKLDAFIFEYKNKCNIQIKCLTLGKDTFHDVCVNNTFPDLLVENNELVNKNDYICFGKNHLLLLDKKRNVVCFVERDNKNYDLLLRTNIEKKVNKKIINIGKLDIYTVNHSSSESKALTVSDELLDKENTLFKIVNFNWIGIGILCRFGKYSGTNLYSFNGGVTYAPEEFEKVNFIKYRCSLKELISSCCFLNNYIFNYKTLFDGFKALKEGKVTNVQILDDYSATGQVSSYGKIYNCSVNLNNGVFELKCSCNNSFEFKADYIGIHPCEHMAAFLLSLINYYTNIFKQKLNENEQGDFISFALLLKRSGYQYLSIYDQDLDRLLASKEIKTDLNDYLKEAYPLSRTTLKFYDWLTDKHLYNPIGVCNPSGDSSLVNLKSIDKNLCINCYITPDADEKTHALLSLNAEVIIYYANAPISPLLLNRTSLSHYEAFLSTLINYGFKKDDDKYVLCDTSKIGIFLNSELEDLKRLSNVYFEKIKNKLKKLANIQTKINYHINWFSLLLSHSEFNDYELAIIFESIKNENRFILLNDGRIIDLISDESEALRNFITELNIENPSRLKYLDIINGKKEFSPVYLLKFSANPIFEKAFLNNEIIEELRNYKNAKVPIPKLDISLKDFQVEGFKWLSILYKYNLPGILADDMGLGKTVQTISLLKHVSETMPCLIVCPASLILNWQKEFDKFDSSTKVVVLYGTQTRRRKIINSINPNEKVVYITSYDSLKSDVAIFNSNNKVVFNYIVLDEAQNIKNKDSIRNKAVMSLSSRHKLALTGTPIINSVLDLYSIFDFLCPGFYGALNEFKRRWESSEQYQQAVADVSNLFMLRRTKDKVLDLPPSYETTLVCELEKDHRKYYDSQILKAKTFKKKDSISILEFINELRRCCVHPKALTSKYKGESNKFKILLETIDFKIKTGHKIVVFSFWTTILDILEEYIAKYEYIRIDGKIPVKKRDTLISTFNSNQDVKLMLASLTAIGVGVNLTAADTVIILEPFWNSSTENQAIDRVRRIGQENSVEIIRIVCLNTIEQKVIDLKREKDEVFTQTIYEDSKIPLKKGLDYKDLIKLIN